VLVASLTRWPAVPLLSGPVLVSHLVDIRPRARMSLLFPIDTRPAAPVR